MNPKGKQKNPVAVAVGSRISQARHMAGYTSIEQLLEALPKAWRDKRSRFTNYEAGISLTPPDIIQMIAEATHCSACWIQFGTGPIRDSGRDIQAIRHQNLVFIAEHERKNKSLTRFLKSVGISRDKLEEYLNEPFRLIEERLARKCEKYLKKPSGWMDEQHVENDPVCQSFPEDIRELMMIYSNLDKDKKNILLKIARTLTDEYQIT